MWSGFDSSSSGWLGWGGGGSLWISNSSWLGWGSNFSWFGWGNNFSWFGWGSNFSWFGWGSSGNRCSFLSGHQFLLGINHCFNTIVHVLNKFNF
jgi:hypothetical protein